MTDEELLKGTAGGFGKGVALPFEEIERLFARCVEDPSMRSVTAILRIAKEQLNAREDPRVTTKIALGCVIIGALATIPYFLGSEAVKGFVQNAFALPFIGLLLWVGSLSTRHTAKAAAVQCDAIALRAVESLEQIVAKPGVKLRSLDWSDQVVLERLVKSAKRGSELVGILTNI